MDYDEIMDSCYGEIPYKCAGGCDRLDLGNTFRYDIHSRMYYCSGCWDDSVCAVED